MDIYKLYSFARAYKAATEFDEQWYYIDGWQLITATWGDAGPPEWKRVQMLGPKKLSVMEADFETNWMLQKFETTNAERYIVRRLKWNGSQWQQELERHPT